MVLGSGPFDLAPPADVPLDAMSTSVPELLQSQSLAIGNVFAKPPAGFDAVYITDEMYRRIPKSTDYKREKLALQDLARQMVYYPRESSPAPC